MKTLILFATRHGSSEKAAQMLKEQLISDVTLHNIKDKGTPDISDFDSVIIGGSIHAGEIQRNIKRYCEKNFEILLKKHLGLYLCCMDKEKAQMQFEKAYNEELRESTIASSLFGGEFAMDKMNFLERSIVKKVAGIEKSVSNIDHAAIKRFAEKFNLLPQ